MAVPAGDYVLHASLDLSPLFGVLACAVPVSVAAPPADVLDRRLEELSSEDVAVRRAALLDIRYFAKDGARIVPAVVARLDDEDRTLRSLALSALGAFPAEAAAHAEKIVAMLLDKDASMNEKSSAAWLLSRVGPIDESTEAAFRKAIDGSTAEQEKQLLTSAFENYKRRANPK